MLSRQAFLRSARAAASSRAIASQVRFYAAPAVSENVKPPVALFGLDGTYATALVRHRARRFPDADCKPEEDQLPHNETHGPRGMPVERSAHQD